MADARAATSDELIDLAKCRDDQPAPPLSVSFARHKTRTGGLVIEHHRPLPGLLVCPFAESPACTATGLGVVPGFSVVAVVGGGGGWWFAGCSWRRALTQLKRGLNAAHNEALDTALGAARNAARNAA